MQPTVNTIAFHSAALKRNKKVNIVLPAGYETHRSRYPVLYMLHGYGGNRNSWLDNTSLLGYIQSYDLITVLPESGRRWFINDHEDFRYEDYLIGELIQFVDSNYRTISRNCARAIAGFSMGGAAAVMQAFRHPGVFSVAASHSAAFEAPLRKGDPYSAFRDDPGLLMPTVEAHERVWGPPGSRVRNEYDPYLIVRGCNGQVKPCLYLDVGLEDYRRMIQMNRNLHQALLRENVPHEYCEIPGGHNWEYLNQALQRSLAFVTNKLCKAESLNG